MSGITCPSPNFTQAFNLWVLALVPLPRRFIKFLWGWLLSPILTGGQRKKANKRNQWWGRQSLHSPPSILGAASSFFFFFWLHVPHCLVLTRALWLSLGPMTPCGRWEDHNRDQGRTWRRAVPSRKTDSEGERKKVFERGSWHLQWWALLIRVTSQAGWRLQSARRKRQRGQPPSFNMLSDSPSLHPEMGFNNLLWETSVTGEVVTSLT